MYRTDDFDFTLPQDLIADRPVYPRDQSKMLVCDDEFLDKKVFDLADYLQEGDVIVLNDARVIKARLTGKRGLATVEINLHKNFKNKIWQVFARPAKRLKIGDIFMVAEDFYGKVLAKDEQGLVDIEFNCIGDEFFKKLEKYGKMPLPPYIKRDKNLSYQNDEENYQTIYAKNNGAVAAPTAGLHFTKRLFNKLEKKGIKKVFVTLNVGAGTFLPVKSDYIKDHKMHSEYFTIGNAVCDIINHAKANNKRIIAVGTTSLRVLETASDDNGLLKPQSSDTEIFIYPPYKFKVVDILMTNFHLPKSTLFMLVAAFIGKQKAHSLYQHAVKNNYRFYSYGDACLLFRRAFS